VTLKSLSILLPLVALCLFSGCKSNSAQQAKAPAATQAAADSAPPEDIAADDPIWNLVSQRQAHLDRVEQNRTGHNDARSCQKAVPGPNHRVKVDSSACTQDQLHAEWDADRAQLFESAKQMMRDRR
jgi:hypothetical protein